MTALAVLPPGADDTQLVRRAREGDLSAFEALVSRYRDQVVRVATRIVGRDEAEDVAQDALLRAFHNLQSFRGDAPFRSWLLRIVHNMSIDARNRRTPIPIEVDDGVTAEVPDSPRPASTLEQHERSNRMALKIRGLKPEHRAVLVLRDLEGLAYDDIARITETPIGSVKGRLHRARKELIEALRNNTYDWELPR